MAEVSILAAAEQAPALSGRVLSAFASPSSAIGAAGLSPRFGRAGRGSGAYINPEASVGAFGTLSVSQ